MDLDPHTLQQIIERIEQQMRCPQCGKRIPVDMTSVRLAGDDFMLLQLRCETCDAFIVLHASLQGAENLLPKSEKDGMVNASSTLNLKDDEVKMLRKALEDSDGSFSELFKKFGEGTSSKGTRKTDIV
ncbi:hypothetical protein HYZ99_04945 [Candidatus Peregrinibacteria bacterium]|nr:hypothetical protein [Candidatus Peregrinibacteria bacterium]